MGKNSMYNRKNISTTQAAKNTNYKTYHFGCEATCPEYDSCPKRILIVGGITKLKSHYRRLVKNSGADFEYHDGYMRSGKQGLEGPVRRSDIVLCPISCNSHGACSSLKRLCRKHKKPFCMLRSASLSSVSKALMGHERVLQ